MNLKSPRHESCVAELSIAAYVFRRPSAARRQQGRGKTNRRDDY